MKYLGWALLLSLAALASCAKEPPADALCRYEPLPETVRAEAGQGAALITGSTGDYVYLNDTSGKSVTSGKIAAAIVAKPGEYRAKLNGSTHPVFVKAKTLTVCTAGTAVLEGATNEYYYVEDGAGTQLASSKLGQPLDLWPGKYRFLVNKTSVSDEVKPGVLVLKSGVLVARGTTAEYYYVLDSAGTSLASSKLSAPVSLLPGKLTLKVNNTTAPVEIKAEGTTEVQTGALLIRGTTDEYYYVLNATGNQLASSKLNQATSYVEGAYTAKVNNVKMDVKVEAGKTSEYQTGTLTVKGSGDAYFYVVDGNGTNLASAKFNQSVALPEGKYSVKIGNETRPVTLANAKALVVSQ